MSPTGQYFASCLPGCTAEVSPIPAVTTRGSQLTLRAISGLMHRSKGRLRGRDASYLAPPAQIRTCGFPAYGLYGAFAVKGTSRCFLSCCCFILSFDPRREHSSVPTAYYHRRRAQRRSRTALLERRRRLVLDHREHGGRMPVSGWFGTRDPREACHRPRAIAAEPRLYSVEPI
jgi:hypothetical protein